MATIDNRELQLFMLGILNELDRICKKYDIQYFLAYGSCLGAVRHKGFIPWDDDIDVCMKADDYLRFMEVCKTELGEEYYFQSHFHDTKTYIYWNRIGVKNSTSINLSMSHIHQPWGICLDIFPLFPYTKDADKQRERQKKYRTMRLLSLKYYHIGTMKGAKLVDKLKKCIHFILPDSLNRKLFQHYFVQLCNAEGMDSKYLTSYDFLPSDGYLENSWFEDSIDLEFEGRKLPCPINYDAYLTKYYRNYMEIPKNKVKHSDDPNVIIKFDECYEKYWT